MTLLEVSVMQLAGVFAAADTAYDVGKAMTCSEANALAETIAAGGWMSEAVSLLHGHITGGDGEGDDHYDLIDEGDRRAGEVAVSETTLSNVRRYIEHELIGE